MPVWGCSCLMVRMLHSELSLGVRHVFYHYVVLWVTSVLPTSPLSGGVALSCCRSQGQQQQQ